MSEPAIAAAPHPYTADGLSLLPIPSGGAATTVYISIWADGTTLKPAFSLTPGGTTYKDGITWQKDPEFGLFLNFQFLVSQLGTILRIDTDPTVTTGLWYSSAQVPAPTGGFNQQCCTQNVTGDYPFIVSIRDNNQKIHRVDPKIVVTPQTI